MASTPFKEAYNKLNEEQQAAANHLDGPMLVIAGPGTGKTELLAIRVGNILAKTDAQPYNILCLTFTDAAAFAMRSRLLKYIGPSAYQVGIYTYHSFCNQVIQENISYFGGYRDLQAISDLERVDVMVDIIDNLPEDHALKRLKGNVYFDKRNLEDLFMTMKKENWTEKDFKEGYEKQLIALDEDPELQYKRKYTDRKTGQQYVPGDRREAAYNKELERHQKTFSAAQLLKNYDEGLKEMERFDFQDMILWVIAQFNESDELLGRYQEQYQYILVDEYQDTNGAQNDLVFQLSSYWERPNLFAVGDDDQSIYRFQGANMNNINDFKSRYNPEIIVLEKNYRSSQVILDAATKLIGNNTERLVNMDDKLSKNLMESREAQPETPIMPTIKVFHNQVQEEVGLLSRIDELVSGGKCKYNDIAVLYREHKEVADLVKYLSLKGIPINVKRKVDVLTLPIIQQLINILKYIHGEIKNPHSEERRLFEILHYAYFDISPLDIAHISIATSRRTDYTEDDLRWRTLTAHKEKLESLGLINAEKLFDVSQIIESWITASYNNTLQVLIEKIVTESKWLEQILEREETGWNLQVFNTFFNLVKEESSRNSSYDLNTLIETIDKMTANSIELPVYNSIVNEEGINFVTAHSSKGLEFKYVFIIKVIKKTWVEKNSNRGFKYPESLVPSTKKSDVEDDRRLFYVAMTRAEDGLEISYSNYDTNDKEMESAVFIHETGITVPDFKTVIAEEKIIEYQSTIMKHRKGELVMIDHQFLTDILQDYKLSATSLNKYLRCPLAFYFENLLRVPMARTAPMGFGNAIHYAMELFFRDVDAVLPAGPVPDKKELIQLYEKGMQKYHSHFTAKEYDNHLTYGRQVLDDYYEEYHNTWLLPRSYKLEHVVDEVSYAGVPIKGKLDKVLLYDDHVEVIDYKTGKYKSNKLKPPLGPEDNGGDYWRQIIFYKMLITSDTKHNYKFGKGTMDFVEKDSQNKYSLKTVEVGELELSIVKEQLLDTYEKITNHQFYGCGEDDCKWCNFVNENESLTLPLQEEADEEHTLM